MKNGIFKIFALIMGSLLLGACGSDTTGETKEFAAAVHCADENDCDQDGVFALCDEDDANSGVSAILPECDDDEDGFVDTPCTTVPDLDGDGLFGDAERLEYGVNCDVCPGNMNDPEQEDADGDGVGELCALEPAIGENAAVVEDQDEVPTGDSPADEIL